ncbi:MAG: class I SAM-dependent methyltransferase [Steroidobacteraceae bacterium]|nr:class I SAM-dependent methyltransferase [Steroidobacteraceae bacterium]
MLGEGAVLLVYGPFRYGGSFTSGSNAVFDRSLRVRDPASGIRDFEAVDTLAMAQGFELQADNAMPANNQLLTWVRNS